MVGYSRRTIIEGAAASGLLPSALSGKAERPRTFLICHGAWSGGWVWRKMRPFWHVPPASALFTPTMTGIGERAHLASPSVDLDTHIRDIAAVIDMEDLRDIILIGHSYGGMVATGVADRAADRIRQLIYLDAFVPEDGQSLYGLLGQPVTARTPSLIPPRPIPPDTSDADRRWMESRRTPQPLGCFTAPLRLTRNASMPPRSYVRCARTAPDDPQLRSARRARAAGWPYREIDASHSPHVTAPDLLAAVVDELVA